MTNQEPSENVFLVFKFLVLFHFKPLHKQQIYRYILNINVHIIERKNTSYYNNNIKEEEK